jgi:diguanylate cyclase (GGDEF)-like protein
MYVRSPEPERAIAANDITARILLTALASDRERAGDGCRRGSKVMSDSYKRIERAEKALHKGKPDLALAEYLAILEEDPENEAIYHTAADLSVSMGRNAEAVRLLSELFERQCAQSDKPKASVTYKKLSRIARPTGQQSLTFANSLAKNSEEALKAYESALQVFSGRQRKREALIALNGIVALAPSVENFRKQGEVAADLELSSDAAAAYVAAGELEKDDDSRFLLFEHAYRLNPQEIQIGIAYAETLLSRGNPDRAAGVIEPFASTPDAQIEVRSLYGRALLAAKRPERAIGFLWQFYEQDPSQRDRVIEAIQALSAGDDPAAVLRWLRKLEQHETKIGRRREFVSLLKSVADTAPPTTEFLEYVAEAFDAANREHDYSDTLIKLFDLHYASGNYPKAAACLDRAAEVDAYEPGHMSRLDMLRGKVDPRLLKPVAARLRAAEPAGAQDQVPVAPETESESTVLEDLITQAVIYFRYSMDAKAVEKLRRVQKLFPSAEQNNGELRDLYARAGLLSVSLEPEPAPLPSRFSAENGNHAPASVDDIERVTEITANLYRQATVKNVLFACVNDTGRHWNASRCLAVLSTPGKPPSVALEYCAPGIKQFDIHSIVKLVGLLQPLAVAHGILELSNARNTKPVLRPLRKPLAAMGIESLLALPLVKGEDHIGLLALGQCDGPREWSAQDTTVLKAIAEQVELAVSNARLRKLVRDLAVTEDTTGLVKRSCYLDLVQSEISAGQRQNSPTSIMLMNFADHGKTVAATGSEAFELMMRHIAGLVTTHVRQNDVAIRYDESTIALILTDTNEKEASQAADKLRKVAAVVSVPGRDAPPQITVGIAQSVQQNAYDPADIATEAVNRAEQALAQAVALGGNQTRLIELSAKAPRWP